MWAGITETDVANRAPDVESQGGVTGAELRETSLEFGTFQACIIFARHLNIPQFASLANRAKFYGLAGMFHLLAECSL